MPKQPEEKATIRRDRNRVKGYLAMTQRLCPLCSRRLIELVEKADGK